MATKYGELFSDEYQKSLKEQFCYADTDPDYEMCIRDSTCSDPGAARLTGRFFYMVEDS